MKVHEKTEEREALRRRLLEIRDRLSPETRRLRSTAIVARLWRLEEFVRARTLFVYVNFRSEVETLPLIRQCLDRDKEVCVPLTDRPHRCLRPYVLTDLDRDLVPGYCSIPEPAPQCPPLEDTGRIDAVILPGSVFDLRGGRLGYGGGYYDRFLGGEAPQALRIGVAFEAQVVDEVPLEPHDQPVHILVTESRTVRMR